MIEVAMNGGSGSREGVVKNTAVEAATHINGPVSRISAAGRVGRAVNAIIEEIRANGLRKGDLLPSESAMVARLQVSRIVVREANRYLAALGIIEITNGRAPRVSMPDENVIGTLFDHVVYTGHVSVQQVLGVRRPLEVRAAALAAVRRTAEQAKQIVGHAAAMRATLHDPTSMSEHDIALHAAIADASQNPLLAIMIKAFSPVTRQTWPVGWRSRTEPQEQLAMIACHEALAEAIQKQDVTAARTTMSAHFDELVKALAAAGVN
jgi:GntR family transcriptional regulator, transcriptional repressor for pyruvate dehydrogenase complex